MHHQSSDYWPVKCADLQLKSCCTSLGASIIDRKGQIAMTDANDPDAVVISSAAGFDGETAPDALLSSNKEVVKTFYETAINIKDFAAASQLVDNHYIQHNPLAA